MGLSSKVLLLSADDTLHLLANSAFMRMLRKEDVVRVPIFAGQRVRQASIVVELMDRVPMRVVHKTFSILDFNTDGYLDVDRLNSQQIARFESFIEGGQSVPGNDRPVYDATNRFIARGGDWKPSEPLMGRMEAVALGHVSCPRVRVTR